MRGRGSGSKVHSASYSHGEAPTTPWHSPRKWLSDWEELCQPSKQGPRFPSRAPFCGCCSGVSTALEHFAPGARGGPHPVHCTPPGCLGVWCVCCSGQSNDSKPGTGPAWCAAKAPSSPPFWCLTVHPHSPPLPKLLPSPGHTHGRWLARSRLTSPLNLPGNTPVVLGARTTKEHSYQTDLFFLSPFCPLQQIQWKEHNILASGGLDSNSGWATCNLCPWAMHQCPLNSVLSSVKWG